MLIVVLTMQEEIVDETDEYVDVHKRYFGVDPARNLVLVPKDGQKVDSFSSKLLCRIRVAAAAAASSVARAPSSRRLTANKGAVSENHVLGIFFLH